MAFTLERRKEVERLIAKAILDAAFTDAKCSYVVIDNGEYSETATSVMQALDKMFATDEEHVQFYGPNRVYMGFMFFTYGECGYDVVNDYSTRLEDTPMVKCSNELFDKYEKECHRHG